MNFVPIHIAVSCGDQENVCQCLWKRENKMLHTITKHTNISKYQKRHTQTQHLNIVASHVSSVSRVEDVHRLVSPVWPRNQVAMGGLVVQCTQETVPHLTLLYLQIFTFSSVFVIKLRTDFVMYGPIHYINDYFNIKLGNC